MDRSEPDYSMMAALSEPLILRIQLGNRYNKHKELAEIEICAPDSVKPEFALA